MTLRDGCSDGARAKLEVAQSRGRCEANHAVGVNKQQTLVGTLEHLYEGAAAGGAGAVLAASIFHFGEHTVRQAKAYLGARGLVVRP